MPLETGNGDAKTICENDVFARTYTQTQGSPLENFSEGCKFNQMTNKLVLWAALYKIRWKSRPVNHIRNADSKHETYK